MKFYFAPMEGVTGYIYRNVHQTLFPGMDKYFTPFVVANQTYKFKTREKKDVAPENNQGTYVVPQIMANKPEEFLWAARELRALGYREINLNLGCPASTVVSKKKGSGFLAYPEELDVFLDTIFEGISEEDIQLSIKTRLGRDDVEETGRLLEIYNRYPLYELIVHPRVQKDFYKYPLHMDVFENMVKDSVHPLCYNGDLFTVEDYRCFTERFPQIKAVMLGRGLIANPGLVRAIREDIPMGKSELEKFHHSIYEAYSRTDLGEMNTLFKMKELWAYMGKLFPDGERLVRKIRKSKNGLEYRDAVKKLFSDCELSVSDSGLVKLLNP